MASTGQGRKTFSPMPLPPGADVVRVRLLGKYEEQLTSNTLHYLSNIAYGALKTEDLQAILTLITAPGELWDTYLLALAAEWKAVGIVADSPTKVSLMPVSVDYSSATGMGPAGTLPSQTAAVITKLTAWRGRHGRGRIAVPCVPRVWATGTTIHALAAYWALLPKLQAVLADGTRTFTPGILAVDRNDPLADFGWAGTVSHHAEVLLGTMRRRKPGVGI